MIKEFFKKIVTAVERANDIHNNDPSAQSNVIIRRRESRARLREMETFLANQWDEATQNPQVDNQQKVEIARAYGSVVSGLHTHYE